MLRAKSSPANAPPSSSANRWNGFGLLVKANEHIARSEFAAALELRDQASKPPPATPGAMDGKPFEWIATAIPAWPLLEVILEGRLLLGPVLPHQRSTSSAPPPPAFGVGPAQFVWTNGARPRATSRTLSSNRKSPTARSVSPEDRLGGTRRRHLPRSGPARSGHGHGRSFPCLMRSIDLAPPA